MLVEFSVIIVAVLLSLLVGAFIANTLTGSQWIALGIQTAVATLVALAAYVLSVVSIIGAIIVFLSPMAAFVTDYLSYRYSKHRMDRALDGKFGDEPRWAAELMAEDDDHFTLAVMALPQTAIKEEVIVAESKEQLRSRMVERFEEEHDRQIDGAVEEMLDE